MIDRYKKPQPQQRATDSCSQSHLFLSKARAIKAGMSIHIEKKRLNCHFLKYEPIKNEWHMLMALWARGIERVSRLSTVLRLPELALLDDEVVIFQLIDVGLQLVSLPVEEGEGLGRGWG